MKDRPSQMPDSVARNARARGIKQMRKSKDRKHAEKKAWDWFSKMIRLEYSEISGMVKCYTCSTLKNWKDIEVGHYYPQGSNKPLKFDERNCHPQCYSCNCKKSGNLTIYAEKLIEQYGSNIFDLFKIHRAQFVRRSQLSFECMAAEYKKRALEAAKLRGITI